MFGECVGQTHVEHRSESADVEIVDGAGPKSTSIGRIMARGWAMILPDLAEVGLRRGHCRRTVGQLLDCLEANWARLG